MSNGTDITLAKQAASDRSLVEVGERFSLAPTTFDQAMQFARIAAQSSMVPKGYAGKPHDILLSIQMGAELGLQPMQSLQNIAVINGRPSVWGDAMLALCKAHPEYRGTDETFDETTMTATCVAKRSTDGDKVRSYSRQDAETQGLWGKQGPWTQAPKRMLQMRARGYALRDQWADVLRGLASAA